MRISQLFALLLIALLASGCAGNKEVNVTFSQSASSTFACPDNFTFEQCVALVKESVRGGVHQEISMNGSTLDTDSTQDGVITPKTDFTIPVADGGGVVNAKGIQKEVKTKLLNTKTDSDNTIDNSSSVPGDGVQPVGEGVETPPIVGFNAVEVLSTKYSKDRERRYQHLALRVKEYGLPFGIDLTGTDCNESYLMTEYDSKYRGTTSFTLLPKNGAADDGVFISDESLDKRGEILLPYSCGEDAEVTINYFAG